MSRLLLGAVCGLVYGALSAASMLPLTFADKRAALAGAFLNRFARGVSIFPVLGADVFFASREDLRCVYDPSDVPSVTIGTLHQDARIAAQVRTDDLLGEHFAVLGTTGT